MPVNRWRGDAPARPKIVRLIAPTNLVGVEVVLTIGNKSLTFFDWDASTIATDFNDSGFPEVENLTATVSGEDVLITGPDDDDFDVSISTKPTVEVDFTQGRNPVNQQTLLSFSGATGGDYTVTVNGETTSAVTYGDVAGLITALEALTGIAVGDVSAMALANGDVALTWQQNLAAVPVAVSMNATGLNNGGTVALEEVEAAYGGAYDVYFLFANNDNSEKAFDLTKSAVSVTFQGNTSADEMQKKLTAAWGGQVRVRHEFMDVAGDIEESGWLIEMIGFREQSTTVTVTNVTPSTSPQEVAITKIENYTAATVGRAAFLLDFTNGSIDVTYRGETITLTAPTSASVDANGLTDGNAGQLNDSLEVTAWTRRNGVSSAALSETLWFRKFEIIRYWGPINAVGAASGIDITDAEFYQSGGSGQMIRLQHGGSDKDSRPAKHRAYLLTNDAANTIDGGTFRWRFAEGETSAIAYNISAASLKTELDSVLGFSTTVSGSGTASSPWVITYTGASGLSRAFPAVFAKKLEGDGGGSVSIKRAAVSAESASCVVRVSTRATSGAYLLKSGAEGPVSFDYNLSAAAFKTELEKFASLSTTADTAVTFDSDAGEYTITYQNGLANQTVDVITEGASTLATSDTEVASLEVDQTATGPGNMSDPLNWSLGRIPDYGDTVNVNSQNAIRYGLRQFVEVSADASTDKLTAAGGFDFIDGTQVRLLTDDTVPGGLSESTTYFVIEADHVLKTFKLSTTENGAAVDITSAGTGPHYVGLIAADISISGRFTEIGRPRIADEDFEEYRARAWCIGLDENGQLDIGKDSASGLIRVDVGTSRGLVEVHSSGQSAESGVPAVVVDAHTGSGSLLVSGGDVGTAAFDDDASKWGSVAIRDGVLKMGTVTVTGNLIQSGGELETRRVSVSGLVAVSNG